MALGVGGGVEHPGGGEIGRPGWPNVCGNKRLFGHYEQ